MSTSWRGERLPVRPTAGTPRGGAARGRARTRRLAVHPAAVAQLLREGLDLAPGVTFLVGENGSGKSTLVEAIAAAAGNNAEGGSRNATHSSRATESPLHQQLQLTGLPGPRRWSYFLRAETMHGHLTYLEDLDDLDEERPRGAAARNPLHR